MNTKQLKIGKEAVLVNLNFIHKGYEAVLVKMDLVDKRCVVYDEEDTFTLFTKIKVEKIDEDDDGDFWINRNVLAKYVFPDVTEAKKFVNNYLKKEILRKSKENLQTALLINYYEQIMLENDKEYI